MIQDTNLQKKMMTGLGLLNKLSIQAYLAANGIYPAKNYGYYGMYHSPFREDHTASMKVDNNKNLWVDYGTGEGGTLVDLVMRMEKCSLPECIRKIEQHLPETDSFSFHRNNTVPTDQKPGMTVKEVRPVTHPALIGYLRERKLNIETAKRQCAEVHYSIKDKSYFAIGFQNNSGGYELRNRNFKGCTSKDITTLKTVDSDCLLFEGFIDYLSLLTLRCKNRFSQNVIVLHSVNNLSKAEKYLSAYGRIYTFFDNDEAGINATLKVVPLCKNVSDQSGTYARYKDLNDYLQSKYPIKKLKF